jgi:hypothetical protein
MFRLNTILPLAVFSGVFLFSIETIYAHPGRTDSSGCHTCRTNCSSWGLSTGEYHCHNAKALPQPEEPIKSRYGENGTGYTEPAPEYKSGPSISTLKSLSTEVTSQKTLGSDKKSDASNLLGWVTLLGVGGAIGYWFSKKNSG